MSYESPNAVTCSQWVRSSAVCVCYLDMILVDADAVTILYADLTGDRRVLWAWAWHTGLSVEPDDMLELLNDL